MVTFFLYYLWIIIGIISIIFLKKCVLIKSKYDYQNKKYLYIPIKFKIYQYLLLISCILIPVINLVISVAIPLMLIDSDFKLTEKSYNAICHNRFVKFMNIEI